MKKFLLTLGTTASIFAPIATVVACDEATEEPETEDPAPEEPAPEAPADDSLLELHGFAMPTLPAYPTSTDETLTVLRETVEWANEYALNIGTGEGVLSVSYEGEISYYENSIAVYENVSGVVTVSDYATNLGIEATDVKDLIDYHVNNLETSIHPDYQFTAAATLLYSVIGRSGK